MQRVHPNDVVDRLVTGCSEIAGHLDLFEGADVVMSQVGYLLRDGVLSHDAAAYVFRVLNRLAKRGEPLVENVLEVLVSTPSGIAMSRRALTGRALAMFEALVVAWPRRRH